jgi:hypothetical protein
MQLIKETNSIHALKALKDLGSPYLIPFGDHLGIALSVKPGSFKAKSRAQFAKVVDFAIEDKDTSVSGERLVTAVRKVDDAQTGVGEGSMLQA